jgi:hypothetical protein
VAFCHIMVEFFCHLWLHDFLLGFFHFHGVGISCFLVSLTFLVYFYFLKIKN